MLPEVFSSSYKQYKNDTSAFTTWLGRAAEACGYKPQPKKKISETLSEKPPSISSNAIPKPAAPVIVAPRLKGKARKAAKQAQAQSKSKGPASPEHYYDPTVKEYAVTTLELQEQLDTISQSKAKISMPSGIKKILERAIDARKRCTEWYETAKDDVIPDNGGHRHFISVLQDALLKLGSTEPADSDQKQAARPEKSAPKAKGLSSLENRFAKLEVEDVDDSFTLSPTEVALATRPITDTDDYVDVYVLVEELALENAFAVFCFFEDLHRIQDSIREVWKDCIDGRTALVIATAVTQSAVTMIRRAEQDICSTLLKASTTNDSYLGLITWLVLPQHHATGTNPLEGRGVDVSPFDNFIFLPTARTLLKYIDMCVLTKRPLMQWPPAIKPLRFDYLQTPEKLETPEHKKLLADDVWLSQVLLELQLPDRMKRYMDKTMDLPPAFFGPINEDIFWKTMRPVWVQGDMSVTSVVMAQIMVDIHNVCGPKLPRFNKQLLHVHKHASESYDFTVDARGRLSTGAINWFNKDVNTLARAHTTMQRIEKPVLPSLKTITLQLFPETKVYNLSNTPEDVKARYGWFGESECAPPEVQAAMDHIGTSFIRPAPADDFITTNNPLYSGGAMLNLLLIYNETGLALENHHRTIFITAHLYNAVRQLKLLNEPWPVMDRIIQIHKKAIFADLIPTTTSEMADRLSYRLNVWRAKGKIPDDGKSSLKEPIAAKTVRMMLDEDPSAYSKALWHIEQQAERQEMSDKAVTQKSNSVQMRNQRVNASQYIARLQTAFESIIDDLSIDYIRLTKRCIKLLEQFRDMWNIEAMHKNGLDGFETMKEGNNSADVGLIFVVFGAFKEAKDVREMGIYTYAAGDGDVRAERGSLTSDPNETDRHGVGLKTAGKVFKNFLAKGNTDFVFPLKMPDVAVLDAQASSHKDFIGTVVRRMESVADLHSVFASSTYVVVEFYTDYARMRNDSSREFFSLARKHSVEGILTFVRANADDIREEAMKYYKDVGVQTYACFKEGKQVKVNGMTIVDGKNRKALNAVVAKLGDLAQKRLPVDKRRSVVAPVAEWEPPKVGYETPFKHDGETAKLYVHRQDSTFY